MGERGTNSSILSGLTGWTNEPPTTPRDESTHRLYNQEKSSFAPPTPLLLSPSCRRCLFCSSHPSSTPQSHRAKDQLTDHLYFPDDEKTIKRGSLNRFEIHRMSRRCGNFFLHLLRSVVALFFQKRLVAWVGKAIYPEHGVESKSRAKRVPAQRYMDNVSLFGSFFLSFFPSLLQTAIPVRWYHHQQPDNGTSFSLCPLACSRPAETTYSLMRRCGA